MNFLLKTIKKELIKEAAGISNVVREWAKVIKSAVEEQNETHREKELEKSQKEDPKINDPFYWEDEYSSYYGNKKGTYGYGSYQYVKPLEQVIIYGDEYPGLYKDFPVDVWVLDNSSRIEYDHNNSGYEKNEYVVYLSMPLSYINLSHLNHEIKHAYDDWNRISSGGKAIKDTWEIKNIYTKDFEKLILGESKKFPFLDKVIVLLYKASKLETPAYLETELDDPRFSYIDIGRELKNFNLNRFLNNEGKPHSKGLQKEFDRLKNYDVPLFKKYDNVVDFLTWVKKYFNKRGDDIFRRSAKMRYVHNAPEKPKQTFNYGQYKPVETDFTEIGGWKYNKEKGWTYIGN